MLSTGKIVALLSGVFLLTAFLLFGRAYYMPLFNQIKGKETIESRIAKLEKKVLSRLENELKSAGYYNDFPNNILLVALKESRVLQVYIKDENGINLLKEYPFTGYSGKLGPKLKEGDRQIPEGVYNVEYLNPNSSFYLSIKIDYPNELDKKSQHFLN